MRNGVCVCMNVGVGVKTRHAESLMFRAHEECRGKESWNYRARWNYNLENEFEDNGVIEISVVIAKKEGILFMAMLEINNFDGNTFIIIDLSSKRQQNNQN